MKSLLLPILAAATFVVTSCGQKSETSSASSGAASSSLATNNPGSTKPFPQALAQRLIGKWLRGDGDYLIEIKGVSEAGIMDAAYFNPNPIKISKTQATMEGSAAKLFIELRDTGYPGCTYTLLFDSQNDRLLGVYYQAALQQSFEVAFERMR